ARVAFTGTYGMLRHGTWADVAVVDAEHLTRVPEHVSLATAAAMPVAYLTAYLALHQAGFSPGKIVLAPGRGDRWATRPTSWRGPWALRGSSRRRVARRRRRPLARPVCLTSWT